MPRTLLSAPQDARRDFREYLLGEMRRAFCGVKGCAEAAQIDRMALSRRVKSPDDLRLGELVKLRRVLKLEWDDLFYYIRKMG